MSELRLPRWRRIAALLAPLDLLLVGWALLLHRHPARAAALWLIAAAFACFLAFLIQTFAWVTLLAFFGRARAREGLVVAALLFVQLVALAAVLWLAGPALQS